MEPGITREIKIATMVAIAASILGCIADTMLLYSPNGGYMDGTYEFLRGIPEGRMLWGHYLGIVAIPFEAAGLLLIFRALRPGGPFFQWSAVVLGLLLFFPGLVYHGSVFSLWEAVNHGQATSLEMLRRFNEPLGAVLAGGFFLLFASFIGLVLSGKTLFRKWIVLFAPPVVYGLIITLYFLAPAAGNLLAPMGFNLSMGLFFLAGLVAFNPGKANQF